MSYDYGLFKTIDESIDHFRKVTDTTITWWEYSLEEVHGAISAIVPEIEWDTVEQQAQAIAFWSNRDELTLEKREAMVTEIKSRDPSTYGQVIRPDWGRFECSIDMEYGYLVIGTSFNAHYRYLVIAIAKALKLSAFDVQTGKRIYNPFDDTEVPGNGQAPGLPDGFRNLISCKESGREQ